MAEKYPRGFNRRHFLTGLGTATASATICPAEATEVMRIGPRKRLESDIEAWNVGLITAHRPELSLAENTHRNYTLREEIRKGSFGLLRAMRRRHREGRRSTIRTFRRTRAACSVSSGIRARLYWKATSN